MKDGSQKIEIVARYTQDMYNKYSENRENDNRFDGLCNRIL